MAQINNKDVLTEITTTADLQVSRDIIPNQLAEKIVPVMEVNPKFFRIVNVGQTTLLNADGTSAIYTAPTNADFFITNATLSGAIKGGDDDYTDLSLTCTLPDGNTCTLAKFRLYTSTAITKDSKCIVVNFQGYPIQVKRGTAINLVQTHAATISSSYATMQGFIVNSKTN